MKKRFGLHVRLYESLSDAKIKVERLEHTIFQTVLMLQNRECLSLSDEQIKQFIQFRRQYCDKLFAHGAYWSNITDIESKGFFALQKEVALAEQLEFTHLVIHPGAFEKQLSEQQRIDYIERALNILLQNSSRIIIVLENSPHKDRSFTADIVELGKLCVKFKNNPRIKVCIDTAHAYVAGYDIAAPHKVDAFVELLEKNIGIENIGLLHCNDTKKQIGSFIDEHAIPGYGNIGMEALYTFVHHPKLLDIPVIFEMPALDESLELDIIQQFIDMEILPS